jgi:hypothetical protein
MTRDELKAATTHLVGEFDSMSEALWNETLGMADIEISCSVGDKRIILMIHDLNNPGPARLVALESSIQEK